MIRLEKEPVDPGPPYEACCFCRAPTAYWTKIAARQPGEQVACCQACARTHKVPEVPTKEAWFEKEERLSEPVRPRPRPMWARA